MAFRTEHRTKAFGAPTPSDLREINEATRAHDARAGRRFHLAQVLSSVPGSLREKRKFVSHAMEAGLLAKGPVPAVETIRNLLERWEAGDQSIEAYCDRHRAGRPREIMPGVIERQIQTVLGTGKVVNARDLTEKLVAIAEEKGVQVPTYRKVHRRIAEAGRLRRASARYGSRAGEIDGLPHARVVSRYAHDTWALDELTMPVWTAVYYQPTRSWVSTLVDVVLVVDVCSGATVGYHLVGPTRRKDENGLPMLSGFDKEDVLLALLSAACPELATDATREFSGYLPDRLRWDNAQAHKSLRADLDHAQIGLDVNPIRVRRAASNGAVERRVKILKARCAGLLGHVDDYLPTDQVLNDATADLARQRTIMAGYTSERETRREPILPEQLLTLEEMGEAFDRIVHRYNYQHVNRMHGVTAADRYQTTRRPRRPRRGADLVRVIEPSTVTVGTSGIVHTARGRTHQYYPMIEGRLVLLDQAVTFHADPCGRGIFLRQPDERLVFLPPQRDWSTEEASLIARNQTAITRMISDGADALRKEEMVKTFGQEGLDAAAEEYAVQARRVKERRRDTAESEPEAVVVPTSRRDQPNVADLWLSDDPEAFIRPRADNPDDEE
jgi:hypothetical protein